MDRRDPPVDAVDGSAVRQVFGRWAAHSTFVAILSAVPSREQLAGSSVAIDSLTRCEVVLSDLLARSALYRAAKTAETFARASFIYEWLTAEPEPAVVVVDLRDSVVLRPLLTLLDDTVETFRKTRSGSAVIRTGRETNEFVTDAPVRALSVVLLAAVAANAGLTFAMGSLDSAGALVRLGLSLVAVVGLGNDASLDELRESGIGRLVAALLEPPEHPDHDERSRGPPEVEASRSRGGEDSDEGL